MITLIFTVAACSPSADVEPGAVPPTLVMWTESAVTTVRDDVTRSLDVAGQVSQVTPGPDGELAWTAFALDPGGVAIVFDGATGESIPAPTVPFFYHWSPTGDQVAFLGNSDSGRGLTFGLLMISEREIRPADVPSPFFFDWSPDGSQLVAHVGGNSLGLIDAETGAITDLGVESRIFPAPSWTDRGILVVSDLGRSIGVREHLIGYQEVEARVVLIDPLAGTSSDLAQVDAGTRLFPGATHIAIVLGVPGRQTIRLIDWSGGAVEVVGAGTIEVVQWSPDGSKLLWTERMDDGRLEPRVWSDGKVVMFDPFVPSETFATAYIPFWDQYDRAVSLWSHDSERFALPTSNEGSLEIVVHYGEETTVFPGFEMAVWSPDGFESQVDPLESGP